MTGEEASDRVVLGGGTVAPIEANFCSVSLEPGLKRKRLHSWVQQDSPRSCIELQGQLTK